MIRWVREFDRTFLVVEDENLQEESFEWKMLQKNALEGLLPLQIRKLNGKLQIYFDISMKQDLGALYSRSGMKGRELRKMLRGIRLLSESFHAYLLSAEDILLSPDYIYIDRDAGEYLFACVPGRSRLGSSDYRKEIQKLAEWLLKHLDHSDPDAVLVGYDIYHRITENPDCFPSLTEKYGTPGNVSLAETGRADGFYNASASLETAAGSGRRRERFESAGENPDSVLELKHDAGSAGRNGSERVRSSAAGSRERTVPRRQRKGENRFLILAVLLVLIGVAADLALIVFVCRDYTQAGGVILLTLAVIWLALRTADQRMNRHSGPWDLFQGSEQDEEQYLEELISETFPGTGAEGMIPDFLSGAAAEGRQRQETVQDRMLRGGAVQNRMIQGGVIQGSAVQDRMIQGSAVQDRLVQDRSLQRRAGMERSLAESTAASARDPLTRVLSIGSGSGFRLKAVGEGEDILMKGDRMVLGSSSETADYVIHSEVVSRVHARLEQIDNELSIVDLNSRNGTFVNGTQLLPNERKTLESGDEVMLANLRYRCVLC